MKLKSFLDIIDNIIPQVIELVEKRYEVKIYGDIMFGGANRIYENQIMDNINNALMPIIHVDTFKYGGELYRDISDIIDKVNDEEDKKREVYNILSHFRDISYRLYPQSIISMYKEMHCDVQGWEMWKAKREDISCFFREFVYHSNEDNVKYTYSKFIQCINKFAITFDCVLLERHIDLLQLQNQWNIYVFEERKTMLYVDYIGSQERVKELLYSVSKLPKQKVFSPYFPVHLDKHQLNKMRRFLIEEELIDKNTSEESILYFFGYEEGNRNVHPIIWLGSKQLARELLEGIYKQGIKSFAQIENIVPRCMVRKDGSQLRLAKNKPVLSTKSDAIKRFLKTITKN